MSEAEVEVVRRAAQAWAEGGVEALLEFADPDIEWQSRPDLPDTGVYRGHDGVRRLIRRFEEDLDDMWYEPRELLDFGDRVVFVFDWGGKGRGSGIEAAIRNEAWVMTVSNGRLVKVHEYKSRSEALEAVDGAG